MLVCFQPLLGALQRHFRGQARSASGSGCLGGRAWSAVETWLAFPPKQRHPFWLLRPGLPCCERSAVQHGQRASLVVVQLLSCLQLFATPWPAARQAPLTAALPGSLLRLCKPFPAPLIPVHLSALGTPHVDSPRGSGSAPIRGSRVPSQCGPESEICPCTVQRGPRHRGSGPCERGESESHSVVSDSLRPHVLYSPWNSPGQSTGGGSHSLLQGIVPTQGSMQLDCKIRTKFQRLSMKR